MVICAMKSVDTDKSSKAKWQLTAQSRDYILKDSQKWRLGICFLGVGYGDKIWGNKKVFKIPII
jgi:hypothetical protein